MQVIECSARRGTHPGFSCGCACGKFDGNDLILHLGMFAYHCLRLIGQLGLTGELAPIRHPAERRRFKTVLQELVVRAAHFIRKARRRVLDFGRTCPAVAAFAEVQDHLIIAGRIQGFGLHIVRTTS